MGRLFGTDGVRGIANKELTPELAFNLGKAGTFVLSSESKRPTIIIGRDTRVSGDMLENALTAGILAVGGNVIKAGIIPTPAVAYLTRYYKADAGIIGERNRSMGRLFDLFCNTAKGPENPGSHRDQLFI